MSRLLSGLKEWGCDVDNTMERMANDEDFYAECLCDIVGDRCFSMLRDALEAGDVSQAFDAAHTLKGVLANVGLTPMYNKVVEIVEPLRAGRGDGLLEKYAELLGMREQLDRILKNR